MAIVYRATLRPTKLELIGRWLPAQPWYDGSADQAPTALGAYRFDDPDGEVGLETHLLRVGDGPVLQVPLTYRSAALAGADKALVGTMDHSVLGQRWVYDGCADPVYVAALTAVLQRRAEQAEELVDIDGHRERREPTVVVTATGGTAASGAGLRVSRIVDTGVRAGDAPCLVGTWEGQPEPTVLATVS
ncbi:MAG: hypothetical protein L0K86_11380 [Actinomycetia bacterium]|nr:hypothetical protein [Actinomycetes bacterium]